MTRLVSIQEIGGRRTEVLAVGERRVNWAMVNERAVGVGELDDRRVNWQALNERWVTVRTVIGAALTGVSAVGYNTGEVGDIATAVVEVTFTGVIFSPTSDYAGGVTIRVNGTAATVTAAILQSGSTRVRFTISPAVDANDSVTFEYDDAGGDWQDGGGLDLADITAVGVVNNVGTHFYFDTADDSVHWVTSF